MEHKSDTAATADHPHNDSASVTIRTASTEAERLRELLAKTPSAFCLPKPLIQSRGLLSDLLKSGHRAFSEGQPHDSLERRGTKGSEEKHVPPLGVTDPGHGSDADEENGERDTSKRPLFLKDRTASAKTELETTKEVSGPKDSSHSLWQGKVAPTNSRDTRRAMLMNEMPEDLRRNVLWERQVSGLRRTVSTSGTPIEGSLGEAKASRTRPIGAGETTAYNNEGGDDQ